MAAKSIHDYPENMTTMEVAEFYRVHRTTVERLARSGELKSYKLGVRRLFKKRDVTAFFENQKAR
jgi:excisionase family DNA binding protein